MIDKIRQQIKSHPVQTFLKSGEDNEFIVEFYGRKMDNQRLTELRKMLAEDPGDAFLNYALAMEHLSTGDKKDAFSQLMQLIESQPDYLPAYYQAGKLAFEFNNPSAESIVTKGIKLAQSKGNKHTLTELQGLLDEYN